MAGETAHDEGRIERFARKAARNSLFLLGGLAVANILLPPVGAAVANGLATLSGTGAVGSKLAHEYFKQRRLHSPH